MLTRLKVTGFKNLFNTDIRFGPFTCIAGPNGSGKSNLFDAISFLSALAGDTLMNAAIRVRDDSGKTGAIRNIFHRVGDNYGDEITLDAEMLVPREGVDDLGQQAHASITFLRYQVTLRYRGGASQHPSGLLELVQENLIHIKVGDAYRHLGFPHKPVWRRSVVTGRRTQPLISTVKDSGDTLIRLAQDQTPGGRPRSFLASNLPRTVLSTVNATESPTALLARREMQSWHLLQLEPSALREPDNYTAPMGLGTDGSHLPATLYRLAHGVGGNSLITLDSSNTWPYEQVQMRLNQLIDDVRMVTVDNDIKRELYTLQVADKYNTYHPARSLSDGTLRFLALAILSIDPTNIGLMCLEEPENGIHPERIPAIIKLLEDISVDPMHAIGNDNPLRQVIVNTHSPAVVAQVSPESLLLAHLRETTTKQRRFQTASFEWLSDTWRAMVEPNVRPLPPGQLLAYLNPVAAAEEHEAKLAKRQSRKRYDRVIDRPIFQLMLPFSENE